MKTSTQNVRHLMLTAVASLLGLSANAQFSQTVSQYPDKAYTDVAANFKLTEVAQQLGTDTTTLVKALQDWYDTNTADGATPSGEAMFQVKVGEAYLPSDATGYNGNFNGIWLGSDQTLQDYGQGGVYHAGSEWDSNPEANVFRINLCQFPDSLKGGESFTNTFKLTYGGKSATFDITYNIEKPADVPEPATVLRSEFDSKMTKTDEITVEATRTDVQGYEATELRVSAKDIAEKLGIDLAQFKTMDLTKMIYTIDYDTDNEGIADDTLTNKTTAGTAPGFWYRQTIYGQGEENQGENSPILGSASYGSDDKIFLEAFKFDGDEIVCNLGQYPGSLKADDNLIAKVYFLYGDKYYLVNYNVKCEAAPVANISDYTKVDEIDVPMEFNQLNGSNYQVSYYELDMDRIKQALGIEDETAIQLKAAKEDDAFYVGGTTASPYGYWMSADGYVTNWKDTDNSPLFITWEDETSPSKIGVGLFPGVEKKAGTSYTTQLYYVAGEKYVILNIKTNIVNKEIAGQDAWQAVVTKKIAKQVVAGSEYIATGNQTTFSLTAAECEELIGTSTPTLYCDLADSLKTDTKLYGIYSEYLCSPAPGVWLGKDGQGHGWSGNEEAPVGICWLQSAENGLEVGDFEIYQAPNANKVGDTYKATLYLVNEDNSKMIQLDFNIAFVAAIESAETVGTENISTSASDGDDTEFTVDLTKAAEALGVTTEELLDPSNKYFKAMTASGVYAEADITNGVTFDTDGAYNAGGDGSYGIIYDTDNSSWLAYLNHTPETEDWKATVSFCFEVNGKQYVFNVTLMDENTFTGISNVEVKSNKSDKIYNLQGIEVQKPVKGQLYIQNGKKFVK